MKNYVKFISDKQIEFAPVNKGSIINYNLNESLLIKDNYKPLVKAMLPATNRIYEITYIEDTDAIYEVINYTESEEDYKKRINKEFTDLKIKTLQSKINNLDIKRIRAVCEPNIKDETTGETWLDYYNAQIIALRNELDELEETYVTE